MYELANGIGAVKTHWGERRMTTNDYGWDTEAAIDPKGALPAYVQLAAILRALIIARRMPVGTPLPSEPALAEQYGVSRDTVRRALRVLSQDLGLSDSKRGVGHFVIFSPECVTVRVPSGSKITGRYPQPKERKRFDGGGMSAFTVLVVEEPGQEPALYDATRTVLLTD